MSYQLRRRETPSPRPSSSSSGPGFVPFQLSDEQYASVCRAPEAHGYPTLATGEVAAHGVKFGYIFVEDRGSVEGRRPKLQDGLDWVPSSSASSSNRLLSDGCSVLVRSSGAAIRSGAATLWWIQ